MGFEHQSDTALGRAAQPRFILQRAPKQQPRVAVFERRGPYLGLIGGAITLSLFATQCGNGSSKGEADVADAAGADVTQPGPEAAAIDAEAPDGASPATVAGDSGTADTSSPGAVAGDSEAPDTSSSSAGPYDSGGYEADIAAVSADSAEVDERGIDAAVVDGAGASLTGGDAAQDAAGSDSTVDTADADSDGASEAGSGTWEGGGPGAIGTACADDAGDGGAGCMAGLTCCAGSCANTTRDPNNCGACGHACSATQFCASPACDDAVVSNLCKNPKAAVLQDPFSLDNGVGAAVAGALASCATPPTFSTVAQDNGSVLDPATHRPLVGPGTTLIAAGGAYGQASVGYLDSSGASPAYIVEEMGHVAIVNRATASNVVFDNGANVNGHHDYFLLVVSVEPISGTLCFTAAGTGYAGTSAAGYYFANVAMPHLSAYAGSWYAYEWTDTDMDSLASAGDTFTLKGSGP